MAIDEFQEGTTYGIVAEFSTAEGLIQASRKTRDAGYKRTDAYTPFPLEGINEALGLRDKWMPFIMLMLAFIGCATGYALAFWAMGIALPINIGGKPTNSWPMYMVPIFELTVLFSAVGGVIFMFALNGLPKPYHPMFNAPNFDRASMDKFFLTIEASDPLYEQDQTMEFMQSLNADNVSVVDA